MLTMTGKKKMPNPANATKVNDKCKPSSTLAFHHGAFQLVN